MNKSLVNLFSGTISTLSRSMNLRARNHEMILNNVANADTPNFKPFKVNVEKAMQTNPMDGHASTLSRTDTKHLAGLERVGEPSETIESGGDNPLLLRGDNNGVDIDGEMAALAKNSLLYKASTQIVASKFKGLKKAMGGGTQ